MARFVFLLTVFETRQMPGAAEGGKGSHPRSRTCGNGSAVLVVVVGVPDALSLEVFETGIVKDQVYASTLVESKKGPVVPNALAAGIMVAVSNGWHVNEPHSPSAGWRPGR